MTTENGKPLSFANEERQSKLWHLRPRNQALEARVPQGIQVPQLQSWIPGKKYPRGMRAMQLESNLREFVKTHVILAPLREFSRSRAASKIPFPGSRAG